MGHGASVIFTVALHAGQVVVDLCDLEAALSFAFDEEA